MSRGLGDVYKRQEQLLADIDDEQELDAVYQHFMEELFEEEEDG